MFWVIVSLTLPSCGGPSSSGTRTSGIAHRAFVSNTVSSSTSAGLFIVNAETDMHPLSLAPISAGTTPGMMVITPNRTQTLVVTSASNCSPTPPSPPCQFNIVSNATESNAASVTLPGFTQSVVVSPDSSTVYVAVPSAKVVNQPQGAIELYGLTGPNPGTAAGEVDIPSVQYLAIDNGGDRLLAFSPNGPNPNSIAVVTPSNLGTNNPVVTYVAGAGIDHPVQAFFSSDDSTAYIVNCGAECGGNQASVQQLNMTNNTLGTSVPACIPQPASNPVICQGPAAGSVALLNGSTMYLAGTPYTVGGGESLLCPAGATQAQYCGQLTIIDLSTMSVTNTSEIIITDGYHDRIAMGANGQLVIGAHTCSEIIPPTPPPAGAEVRGCLSIYNTLNTAVGTVPAGAVVIPPANGDVTGLQPIASRDVVYVVQGYPTPGGSLYIYCTVADANINCPTADALQLAPGNQPSYAPLIVGNFFDVKTVDF